MKIDLDHFQLAYYIKGSVASAHGQQEIWHRVIKEFVPKLTDEEKDFLWWVSFRDFWHTYLTSASGIANWAAESYLQGLAALNRNNRYRVTCHYKGEEQEYICYKFRGKYHRKGDAYTMHIAEEYITKAEQIRLPKDEPNMPDKFVKDWQDLSLYDKTPEELLNTRKGFI